MPPVKLTEAQKLYKNFWGNVEKKRVLYDVSLSELAISAHVSLNTIYNRKNHPETTTLREMQLIAQKLHTTVVNLLQD
jgi:hypothetical protein